jgi:hypothetical protein
MVGLKSRRHSKVHLYAKMKLSGLEGSVTKLVVSFEGRWEEMKD